MKRLLLICSAVAVAGGVAAAPAVAGLAGNASFSHQLPVHVPSQASIPQIADDHGHDGIRLVVPPTTGRGSSDDGVPAESTGTPSVRHAEPGDDRGSLSPEPGGDHGSATNEPSDDATTSAPEPGDDNGGQHSSPSMPADDKGSGASSSSGAGDDRGHDSSGSGGHGSDG